MVVEINPLGSVAPKTAQGRTETTSTPSGSAAPVAKPQQQGAAAPSAPNPQNAQEDAQDEPKEEPRRRSSGPSLADLGGTRLSILQDSATQRFVYRGVNAVTKEVERQFPTDAELARSAFLQEIRGSKIDEQT